MNPKAWIYNLRYPIDAPRERPEARVNRKSKIGNRKWFRLLALSLQLLAICLWLLPDRANALDPSRSLLQYNCRTWSRPNGLPANGINAITQDRDGYLWLGTSAGLVRFDGTDFRLLDLSSVSNLPNPTVTSLAIARDGGLWVGLAGGSLGYFDGHSFSYRGRPPWGAGDLTIRSIIEQPDGALWLATEFEVTRLPRGGTFERPLASGPVTNDFNVNCEYEDREGRLWFGTTSQGLYYRQAGKVTELNDPELDGIPIFCLAEDREGHIWVGTANGLRCIDANLRPKPIPPLFEEVLALLVDDHDALWIGTTGRGLGRYQNGNYEFLQKTDGLASDYVTALAEDRERSLWVGTRDGVSQLMDVKFPTEPAAEDPTVKDALAVGASRQGGVWIGTSRGVTYFDPASGSRKTYSFETGLPSRYIKRVFEARDGDLYLVCGARNLAILSPEKRVAAVFTNANLVVGMAEDARGVVVSVGGDLYRAGTNYFRPYAFTNGQKPPMYWILNLASGRDGAIWVASAGGIFRVKDGAYRQWPVEAGGQPVPVLWVCEDRDGVVWGATLRGIVRLKDDQVRFIDKNHGLFDNNIYSVVPDDLENLWVDSGRGIFSVSRQNANDFADGKIARVACTRYDGMESVKPSDKTSQERVGCKTPDGRIWFPSANGVVMIDPAHISINHVVPPVHIDLVRADGRDMPRGAAITVPPGKGELEIRFNAVTFIAPQRTRFRYRLQGYNDDWVDAGNRRVAFYTNLKPGAYAFQVMAANADGVWNRSGDNVDIKLLPHYYQTAWFDLLCVGLAGGALAGLYAARVRHLTRKQAALQTARVRLETEIASRTAELAKVNEALKIENAGHKQAQESLHWSREEFKDLFDNAPVGFHELDAEGRIVRINNTELKMQGYAAEEVLGQFVWKISADEAATHQNVLALLRGEKPMVQDFERNFRRKDGSTFPVMISTRLVRRNDGAITGLRAAVQDITEQKQVELALRETQALYHSLVGQMPAGIFRKDRAGRFVFANPWFCQLRGLTADQIIGRTPEELLTEEEAAHHPPRPEIIRLIQDAPKHHEEILRTGQPVHVEEVYPTAEGGQRHLQVLKTAVFDAGGNIVGTQGIQFDITALKQAQRAMASERDLLQMLMDNCHDDIYFKDTQSRFIKASQSMARQFGVAAPEQILGKTDFDFFDDAHARPAFEDEQEIIRTGQSLISKEEQEVWKDGRVTWASSTKMPLRDAAGKIIGVMGISRDITERKRLEDHLFQSQKMETVGKLAGGIAHEFNSILTAIIGQCALLLQDLPAGSPLAKNTAEISHAAERAATLTRQLLAYGRKQFLRPQDLNLNQVITSMSGVLSHLLGGEMVQVTIVPAAGLKAVKADAGQIEQVIINLAMNARDAMPHGGKFTLETANVTLDQEYVGRYPELKAGEYVMLAVTDTGCGMSESVKARVFEPFFTTKGVGQGTGLGLSTCYGIIKQSGGHVSVYSEPGRGTTFKIYLPQVEPPVPKPPAGSNGVPDLPRGTETILLVEDDPALREMAATLLRRLGYTVLVAANGVEALSLQQQPEVGHVDLLFTDVVMPHMSGKELSERVRALFPHTRILCTSAYTENAIAHQGVLEKDVAVLPKPFTPSALAGKVRETLDAPVLRGRTAQGGPGAPPPASAPKTNGSAAASGEVLAPQI